jgi:hypothetical protein
VSGEVVSERRFRWLLNQRQYQYWPEEKLQDVIIPRRTRPDFFVRTPTHGDFLVEAESFVKPTALRTMGPRVSSLDPMKIQKRINRAVRNAASN